MSKKIGFIAAFLIAACLSFFTTKVIVDNKDKKVENVIKPTVNPGKGDNDVKDTIPNHGSDVKSQIDPTPNPDPIQEKIVLSGTTPIYNKNNKTYSFTSKCSGNVADPHHYELWSNKLVSNSKNGVFTNIPPIKGGKYKLCLVSDVTGKNITSPITVRGFNVKEEIITDTISPKKNEEGVETKLKEKPQKKLISEEDFQRRMLDKSDKSLHSWKKGYITKGFRVVVVNANPDDGSSDVSDVQDVRDMIHTYNKWNGARVVELEYDETGHVTVAKIAPIY